MRDDTIKLVNVKLILVAFFITFIAKAFKDEGSGTVARDFLHATRETYLKNNKFIYWKPFNLSKSLITHV
jgi:hypothetical protein